MARKKETKPVKKDSLEDEWFHLPHCMDCGRVIPDGVKNYTVKYRNRVPMAVVCPACATKGNVRVKTPYISYDGLKMIELMGGE